MPCSQKTLLSSDAHWEHTEICMVHHMQQNSLHFTVSEGQLFYAVDNTFKSHP